MSREAKIVALEKIKTIFNEECESYNDSNLFVSLNDNNTIILSLMQVYLQLQILHLLICIKIQILQNINL